jgi:hypothetical protein
MDYYVARITRIRKQIQQLRDDAVTERKATRRHLAQRARPTRRLVDEYQRLLGRVAGLNAALGETYDLSVSRARAIRKT